MDETGGRSRTSAFVHRFHRIVPVVSIFDHCYVEQDNVSIWFPDDGLYLTVPPIVVIHQHGTVVPRETRSRICEDYELNFCRTMKLHCLECGSVDHRRIWIKKKEIWASWKETWKNLGLRWYSSVDHATLYHYSGISIHVIMLCQLCHVMTVRSLSITCFAPVHVTVHVKLSYQCCSRKKKCTYDVSILTKQFPLNVYTFLKSDPKRWVYGAYLCTPWSSAQFTFLCHADSC